MTVSIIITDFEIDKRIYINLEQEDFDFIKKVWNTEDKLLVELQDSPIFENKTKWSDLSPMHYRLMILKNLSLMVALTNEERMDFLNPTIKSLRFLLSALVYSLEMKSESLVELMRITRINDMQVIFDYSANINICFEKQIPNNKLRVVVDNDKNEE